VCVCVCVHRVVNIKKFEFESYSMLYMPIFHKIQGRIIQPYDCTVKPAVLLV